MDVSVYIPYFNAKDTICDCLRSVLKQSYKIKDIYIIDDGSGDDLESLLSGLPVKIIKNSHNQGLAFTRNVAVKTIDADFLASVDADCVVDPDWLEHLMVKFTHPKIAGAGGRLKEKNLSTRYNVWRSVHMKQSWEDIESAPKFIYGSNTVFLKRALLNTGLYNEELGNNYEDVDISRRLVEAGYELSYEKNATAWHLKNDNINTLLNSYWRWHFNFYKIEKYYEDAEKFIFKIRDNLGLSNRYIEEDMASKRYDLLYLDFLLGIHHSLKDFEYYYSQKGKQNIPLENPFVLWLCSLDLTYFFHNGLDSSIQKTLISKENLSAYNFITLILVLNNFLDIHFRSLDFKKIFYRDLIFSVYKISNPDLLEKIMNLTTLGKDWKGLINKIPSDSGKDFLKVICDDLELWLGRLLGRFPDLPEKIMNSCEN